MKKTLLVMTATLLVLATMVVGCATKAPPAATTPEQPPTIVEGTLEEVSPEQSTVTVETPQGRRTFPISPSTGITIEGQSCNLADLEALEASGEPYNCIVVYDEQGEVVAFNVTKLPKVEPASVRGTISDVNITDSTVTVQTGDGPKVYEVDPATGLLIGGVACSLQLIDALIEDGAPMEECTVIYDVDSQGKALYIDIANPPANLTQDTGTLTQIDRATSTVTIQTDRGPRTYEVDAETGIFLGGEVCSLDEVQDEVLGPNCEVLYYTDSDGNLVYIDVTALTD